MRLLKNNVQDSLYIRNFIYLAWFLSCILCNSWTLYPLLYVNGLDLDIIDGIKNILTSEYHFSQVLFSNVQDLYRMYNKIHQNCLFIQRKM